jgi:poly-beta-hydroxyalkanoate depolymerase
MVSPPPVLSAVQLFAEKRDDRGVEVAMKGGPIERRRVPADIGCPLRERRAARREKVEMAGERR